MTSLRKLKQLILAAFTLFCCNSQLIANCIAIDDVPSTNKEYTFKARETLSLVLARFRFDGKRLCLYGSKGWVILNKKKNPNIKFWTRIEKEQKISLSIPEPFVAKKEQPKELETSQDVKVPEQSPPSKVTRPIYYQKQYFLNLVGLYSLNTASGLKASNGFRAGMNGYLDPKYGFNLEYFEITKNYSDSEPGIQAKRVTLSLVVRNQILNLVNQFEIGLGQSSQAAKIQRYSDEFGNYLDHYDSRNRIGAMLQLQSRLPLKSWELRFETNLFRSLKRAQQEWIIATGFAKHLNSDWLVLLQMQHGLISVREDSDKYTLAHDYILSGIEFRIF